MLLLIKSRERYFLLECIHSIIYCYHCYQDARKLSFDCWRISNWNWQVSLPAFGQRRSVCWSIRLILRRSAAVLYCTLHNTAQPTACCFARGVFCLHPPSASGCRLPALLGWGGVCAQACSWRADVFPGFCRRLKHKRQINSQTFLQLLRTTRARQIKRAQFVFSNCTCIDTEGDESKYSKNSKEDRRNVNS